MIWAKKQKPKKKGAHKYELDLSNSLRHTSINTVLFVYSEFEKLDTPVRIKIFEKKEDWKQMVKNAKNRHQTTLDDDDPTRFTIVTQSGLPCLTICVDSEPKD